MMSLTESFKSFGNNCHAHIFEDKNDGFISNLRMDKSCHRIFNNVANKFNDFLSILR